jgi:cysteine-rich repeat protein
MDASLDSTIRGLPVCGNGAVEGAEVCDDGNQEDGDGCAADCGAREVCGDGVVAGEICDDGNSVNGDGCDNDCTLSCTADVDCDDAMPCNGTETCGPENACQPGAAEVDGTSCGGGLVCRGGSCALTTCGDTMLDPGEDCDDGNEANGDGCDNDCSFSCVDDVGCADENPCTIEICVENACLLEATSVNGTPCDRDGTTETIDLCLGGMCARSVCGDGWVDAALGEECDDDNLINGDGCDNDCTFSCTEDGECVDAEICNGMETCDPGAHVCRRGPALRDGTSCGVGGFCASGVCRMLSTGDGSVIIDSGPTGGDASPCPAIPTSDMPLECFKECASDTECIYANAAGSCCCGCTMGGASEAINAGTLSAWEVRTGCAGADCRKISCMSVNLCPRPPTCIAGQCTAGGGSTS